MSAMTSKTKSYYIHSAITVILMFIGWFLPPMFGLPAAGMKCLGIFLGMLWGWIFVEFSWTSLLGIIAMGLTGVISIPQALLTAFGTDMFLQLLFCMIFVVFLELTGFSAWFAKTVLRMKVIKGHPWRLITAYFLLASALYMFINTFAVLFLVWAIFKETAKQCGFEKQDLTVAYVLMGVAMMTTSAPMIMPFRTYPIMLQGILAGLGSSGVPFMPWLICNTLAYIFSLVGYLLLGKFVFRIDVSKFNKLPDDFYDGDIGKMTFEMKFAVVLLATFVATLAMASLLPAGVIKSFLSGFNVQGTAVVMIIFILAYRRPDGSRLATTQELASRGVSWDSLFLLCSTLTLAAVFKLPEVGIVNALTTGLLPYIQGMSPTMFIIVCCIIFWAVTQVTHNMVIVLVLVGALSEVLLASGTNPWAFAFMFMTACQYAFATPAACAMGAIAFGDEWVGRKNAYKLGIAFTLLAVPFTILMTPIALMLFGSFV